MKKLFLIAMGLFWIPVVWADLNDGLVAHYPFNGNANDESGNGNHGIVDGAALTDDRFGNKQSAYNFDGINDKIEIPDNFNILAPATLTISVWAKRIDKNGGNGSSGMILYKGNYSPSPNMAYSIEVLDNTYSLILRSDTAGGAHIKTVSMKLNKWYHLLGIFDNSTKQKSFYVNGELVGKLRFNEKIKQKVEPLCIGAYCYEDAFMFNGNIDDIYIYNRALTESEIQQLYQINNQTLPNNNCTEADLEKARNQATEEAKKACQANPTSCGINVGGEVAAAVIDSDLSLHVSKAQYKTLLSTQHLWIDMKFFGNNENGKLLWELRDYGEVK